MRNRRPRAFLPDDVVDPDLRATLTTALAKVDQPEAFIPPPPAGVRIDVVGEPRPAGSKTAYALRRADGSLVLKRVYSKRYGREIVVPAFAMTDAGDGAEWREAVAREGRLSMHGASPYDGPLLVLFLFRIERPQYHHVAGDASRPIKAGYLDALPTVKPDTSKLTRAAEDALTGPVWVDDAQIVRQASRKVYCAPGQSPGVSIIVRPIIRATKPTLELFPSEPTNGR